jgi:hypothetical protein
MKNTITPASFLAVALSKKRKVVKTDTGLFVMGEEENTATSRLYLLFFNSGLNNTSPAFTDDNSVPEPGYYSSYE